MHLLIAIGVDWKFYRNDRMLVPANRNRSVETKPRYDRKFEPLAKFAQNSRNKVNKLPRPFNFFLFN